jgi:virginiamycin B lyase
MRVRLFLIASAIAFFVTGLTSAHQPKQSGEEELPTGEGKAILQSACTSCHDLKEVTKFKGYYDLDEWRDIIRTMVAYGAKLDDAQSATLAEYLAKHFGRKSIAAPQ